MAYQCVCTCVLSFVPLRVVFHAVRLIVSLSFLLVLFFRSVSEEVSQRLEACEDELKELESALEDVTEEFERAAERLGIDIFG